MSEKSRLTVDCPECGCVMSVDIITGKVISHQAAAAPAKDFDALMDDLDTSKTRANEVFEREVSALEDQSRLMDEKFEEALRQAKKEPLDKPPERPFDLD